MDELVSKRDVILMYKRLVDYEHLDEETFIENVKALTPAQPAWISCNERMPEDYTEVLVWFEYFRYGDYNRLYQTYGIGCHSSDYDLWAINHETGWRDLKVYAWMPMPAPWKGGE